MAAPLGIDLPIAPAAGIAAPAAPSATGGGAPVVAFATPPPVTLDAAAVLTATVLGRNGDGALLLRTVHGQLALRTALPLPPGSRVDLRVLPGPPPAAVLLRVQDGAPTPAPPTPSTALDLGTTLEATVVTAAPEETPQARPVGTRLVLRLVVAPPPSPAGAVAASPAAPRTLPPAAPDHAAVLGRVIPNTDGEMLVETPVGTLALDRRLALPPGAIIGFEQLDETPPATPPDEPLAQHGGWPALDDALAVLDRAAPALATRLRNDLSPAPGARLAGTLLFLMGALGSGTWPGAAVERALAGAGHDHLRARLAKDVTELRQLGADPATGDWRVFVLPMLDGAAIQPVRLYLRRRDRAPTPAEDGARFVIEVEMSRLGTLQLDGLLRGKRFDLVLRSRRALPPALRQEIAETFHDAIAADGLAGDIAFTTASRFAVAPLDPLRTSVEVEA